MEVEYRPEFIQNLPADHQLIFNVGSGDVSREIESYRNVVHRGRQLCAGREREIEPQQNTIHTIPATVVGNPPVFTIRITGTVYGFNLDLVLLSSKKDNYLYCVSTHEGWKKTQGAKYSVRNAQCIAKDFSGSYSCLNGAKIQFGYQALMRAAIGLQCCSKPVVHFMCIVANLYEPIRFPVIEELFVNQLSQELNHFVQPIELPLNPRRLG